MRIKKEKIHLAIKLLCESSGIRATSRITGLHQETVLKLLKISGTIAANLMEEKAKNLRCENISADEVHSFVYAREHNIKDKSPDWHQQRIYALEATATVVVRPLEAVEGFENLPKSAWFAPNPILFGQPPNAVSDDGGTIHLYLGRSWRMAKGWDIPFADIVDDKAQRSVATEINGTNQWLRFVIHFGGHNLNNKFSNALDFENVGLTPDDLDAIKLVLPIRCEIVWGELQMSIDNGLTNRIFQIPKQKTFEQSATSVETNGIFVPLDFSSEVRALYQKK